MTSPEGSRRPGPVRRALRAFKNHIDKGTQASLLDEANRRVVRRGRELREKLLPPILDIDPDDRTTILDSAITTDELKYVAAHPHSVGLNLELQRRLTLTTTSVGIGPDAAEIVGARLGRFPEYTDRQLADVEAAIVAFREEDPNAPLNVTIVRDPSQRRLPNPILWVPR